MNQTINITTTTLAEMGEKKTNFNHNNIWKRGNKATTPKYAIYVVLMPLCKII